MRTSFYIFRLALLVWASVLMLPAALHAQFNYTIDSGRVTITRYTGSGGDVVIPTINGLPVTSINALAFTTPMA